MKHGTRLIVVLAIALIGFIATSAYPLGQAGAQNNTEIPIKGNGIAATVARDAGPIKKIVNTGNINVNVVRRSKPGVEITADSNVTSEVITKYKRGRLTISIKVGANFTTNTPLVVTVFTSQLRAFLNSGGGNVTINGSFPLQTLTNDGSGKITGELSALKKMRIGLSGSAVVNLRGKINLRRLQLAGNATANIVGINSKELFVKNDGQGEMILSGKTNVLNAKANCANNTKDIIIVMIIFFIINVTP